MICNEVTFDHRIGRYSLKKAISPIIDEDYEEIVEMIDANVAEEGGWVPFLSSYGSRSEVNEELARNEIRYTALCHNERGIEFHRVFGDRRRRPIGAYDMQGSRSSDFSSILKHATEYFDADDFPRSPNARGNKKRKRHEEWQIENAMWVDIGDWFSRFLHSETALVFQDGIATPVAIDSICRVGFVAGVANFTGDAKFKLNISRNAI